MSILKKILIKENSSLLEAILKLNNTGTRCLFVVGEKNIFKGTLTDGDVRRSIIKNKSFKTNINNIYNKKSFYIFEKDKKNKNKIKNFLNNDRNQLIPVLNDKKIPVAVLPDNFDTNQKKLKNLVLVMAGGKGTRLKPYTDVLPKPLIPYKNKPMIINILDKFKNNDFNNFLISVRQNDKILQSFLSQFDNKYNLNYFKEGNQLGTAGCLKKIKKQNLPFFMVNCDTLVNVNPKRILHSHNESKSILTVVVCLKSYQIPYGEFEVNKKGFLKKIEEKPQKKLLANVGMYVLNPEVNKYIKTAKILGMDELIKRLLKLRKKICIFPIKEDEWIDTGNWNNYFEAIKKQ